MLYLRIIAILLRFKINRSQRNIAFWKYLPLHIRSLKNIKYIFTVTIDFNIRMSLSSKWTAKLTIFIIIFWLLIKINYLLISTTSKQLFVPNSKIFSALQKWIISISVFRIDRLCLLVSVIVNNFCKYWREVSSILFT